MGTVPERCLLCAPFPFEDPGCLGGIGIPTTGLGALLEFPPLLLGECESELLSTLPVLLVLLEFLVDVDLDWGVA